MSGRSKPEQGSGECELLLIRIISGNVAEMLFMRWSGGRVGLRRRIKAPFSQGARVQIPSGLFWKNNLLFKRILLVPPSLPPNSLSLATAIASTAIIAVTAIASAAIAVAASATATSAIATAADTTTAIATTAISIAVAASATATAAIATAADTTTGITTAALATAALATAALATAALATAAIATAAVASAAIAVATAIASAANAITTIALATTAITTAALATTGITQLLMIPFLFLERDIAQGVSSLETRCMNVLFNVLQGIYYSCLGAQEAGQSRMHQVEGVNGAAIRARSGVGFDLPMNVPSNAPDSIKHPAQEAVRKQVLRKFPVT